LSCSLCKTTLWFLITVVGGVEQRERWDYFQCGRCGLFYYYRHLTRTLRLIDALPES
jgi:hypothetical protein